MLGITFHLDLNKMKNINYEKGISDGENDFKCLQKVQAEFVRQSKCNKTMAIPKLVISFLCSQVPHATVIVDRIERIFNDFLWDGITVKISNKQLEKDISEGGLKLMNVKKFNEALKISWIKRLLYGSGSRHNVFQYMVYYQKKLFWKLDIDSLKVCETIISNPFWKDVIKSWYNYKEIYINEIDVRTFPQIY